MNFYHIIKTIFVYYLYLDFLSQNDSTRVVTIFINKILY